LGIVIFLWGVEEERCLILRVAVFILGGVTAGRGVMGLLVDNYSPNQN